MSSSCCTTLSQEIDRESRGSEVPSTPDLSIAEVRKALSSLRKGWEDVQVDPRSKPLYLCNNLVLSGDTQSSIRMESFALRFVLAHHQKRHSGSSASTCACP